MVNLNLTDITDGFFSVDPNSKVRAKEYARKIVGLTLWPEDPESPFCIREIDKLSIDEILAFNDKVADLVRETLTKSPSSVN